MIMRNVDVPIIKLILKENVFDVTMQVDGRRRFQVFVLCVLFSLSSKEVEYGT